MSGCGSLPVSLVFALVNSSFRVWMDVHKSLDFSPLPCIGLSEFGVSFFNLKKSPMLLCLAIMISDDQYPAKVQSIHSVTGTRVLYPQLKYYCFSNKSNSNIQQ